MEEPKVEIEGLARLKTSRRQAWGSVFRCYVLAFCWLRSVTLRYSRMASLSYLLYCRVRHKMVRGRQEW